MTLYVLSRPACFRVTWIRRWICVCMCVLYHYPFMSSECLWFGVLFAASFTLTKRSLQCCFCWWFWHSVVRKFDRAKLRKILHRLASWLVCYKKWSIHFDLVSVKPGFTITKTRIRSSIMLIYLTDLKCLRVSSSFLLFCLIKTTSSSHWMENHLLNRGNKKIAVLFLTILFPSFQFLFTQRCLIQTHIVLWDSLVWVFLSYNQARHFWANTERCTADWGEELRLSEVFRNEPIHT